MMRQSMLLLVCATVWISVSVWAQDDPATTDNATPAVPTNAASSPGNATDDDSEAAAEDASEAQGAAATRAADRDEEFIPSEEAPPYEQVVFPVDI